ncbi:MAG TPA: hypothetical protein PK595_03100 [Bacteroidota bacterium]|jgi:hypothetical protein|nr:hypothetical protein [Bacteroidota bacterium]
MDVPQININTNGINTNPLLRRQGGQIQVRENIPADAKRFEIEEGKENSVITQEEQKFFEQLYPDATNEVRAYQTYRRDGSHAALTTGTHIDRKG